MGAAGRARPAEGLSWDPRPYLQASPKTLVRSRPWTAVGALPAQEFLPTPQDTVPLTWPKGYRRQDKGRHTDLPTRFHQGVPVGEMDELKLGS